MVGERGDLHGLAVAREDRQRDIVEHGKPVEQVDDLEAARNPGLDPFVHGRGGDVVALEQDLAAVGLEMRADQIDERCLAGAVRADQRKELALVDDEVHAVAGAGLAELLAKIDRLKKDHEDFSFGRSLAASAEIAPTMPVGSSMTSSTRTTPSRSCQYSVVRDRIGLEIGEDDAADDRAGEVAEAAEQRGEHDLAGERPVQHFGRGEAVERHPENAGETGERSRDQKGDPAEPADPHARERRRASRCRGSPAAPCRTGNARSPT